MSPDQIAELLRAGAVTVGTYELLFGIVATAFFAGAVTGELTMERALYGGAADWPTTAWASALFVTHVGSAFSFFNGWFRAGAFFALATTPIYALLAMFSLSPDAPYGALVFLFSAGIHAPAQILIASHVFRVRRLVRHVRE